MPLVRRVSEGLARTSTRRGFLSRGADVAFGALIGAAAGGLTRPGAAAAGGAAVTVCTFPGPACPCDGCNASGTCGKPCIIMTYYYAGGCWVRFSPALNQNVTCCDCDCRGFHNQEVCGCGSDYHNDPAACP
jgi:hypothetical protein